MRAVTLSAPRPSFRRVALFALALVAGCFAASAQTTTFSGTVYSPFGPNKGSLGYAGDPIPNILVFVQDSFPADAATGALPVFTQGVTVPKTGVAGCDAQQNLVPKTVLGSALTTAAGTFTFNVTGQLPDPVVIVIQAGKWRKQYSYPLASLTTTKGLQLSMPSAQVAGPTGLANLADLPHIAVVTGDADQVECIFQQIGIAGTEITDPSGSGSINLFEGDGAGGSVATTASNAPKESQLLNPAATNAIPMTNYDLVIFGCQGSPSADSDAKQAYAATTLQNYTADSGRLLLTHYEWPFLSTAFPSIATWSTASTYSAGTNVNVTGVLNPNYSGFSVLEGWMSDIGALTATTPNATFLLPNVRQDVNAITSSAVEVWATVPTLPAKYSPAIQFSFNTPLGQSGTPSVTVAYTNNTTQFLRGDTNDSITATVTNTGTVATSGTVLTLTLQLPAAFTNTVVTDPTGGWICPVLGSVATCTHAAPLAAGASDAVVITFGISSTAVLGQTSLSSTISGGNLNNSEQCGRVLFNDYHVEQPTGSGGKTGSQYQLSSCPAVSASGLTAAQKFLEYSLYALSNFVSPSTTDVIQISATPNLTWNPASTYYYGTDRTVYETATSDVSAGTFTYTATPTPSVTTGTLWDTGTYSITATFTPTDTVDYTTASITKTLQIVATPTVSAINNLVNPIYYGQEIGYDPVQGDATLDTIVQSPPATYLPTVLGGTFQVTIDGTVVCMGTQGGVLTGGTRPGTCPDTNFQGWNAGNHVLALAYGGNNDFQASTPYTTTVKVQPDPTTTLVSSSNANSVVHDNLTFTATVSNAYATSVGTVNFYDVGSAVAANAGNAATPNTIPVPAGSVLIGTAPLVNGTASTSLTNLIVGTHYIVACFVGAQNSSGTYNFIDTCSGAVTQVIVIPPAAPEGTATFLTTSQNPSAVGQAVTFTAAVKSTGAVVVVPNGTVSITADGNSLGTVTLDATGTATVTTNSLTLGSHAIVAKYAGTTTLAASTGPTLTQVVEDSLTAAGTGFVLTVTPSPTVDVSVGGSTVLTVQVTELTNFSQAVGLTCSGLPAQAQCIFAQSTLPASGGTTQVLVSASAPHNCNSTNQYFVSGMGLGWPMFGLGMLTLCVARKRKKLQAVALTVMLVAMPSMLTGCGGGNCTDFGVKPGDYSFTITATSKGTPSVVKSQAMTMHAHL